ncbi:MAG: hypothetical protein J6S67_07825 [Methanobrevibacter sp.]|nr:hypothetical protein [Methanobrevibacter sp.]
MAVQLKDYQIEAVNNLKNGSILCGGVGSGKSITSLAYFYEKVCLGKLNLNGDGITRPPLYPKDLYIITTAKKRNSKEWEKECAAFGLSTNIDISISGIKVTIDSWNNIKKYTNVYCAFFIFDEQRVTGKGAWVKAFLKITRRNQWILASATPGDKWEDYIPVFIANGFYKNKTELSNEHFIYDRFSKYPKIRAYTNEIKLRKFRDSILVHMKDNRVTVRHKEEIICDYDKEQFRRISKDRWDIYDNCPIQETGKFYYLLRKVVNSDISRVVALDELVNKYSRIIIFYNFTYELEILRKYCEENDIPYSEYNGQKHEEILDTPRWLYLVQYQSGCEGWNCIVTNVIIFYSQSYSYRQTEQAAGRIDRINTPFTDLYYYYLRSSAWIDLEIRRALKQKRNFNESSSIDLAIKKSLKYKKNFNKSSFKIR